jgi:hypothetical protein
LIALAGRIVDAATGRPCAAGWIEVSSGTFRRTASQFGGSGVVRVALLPGRYRVEVSCVHQLSQPHYDDIVITDHDVVDRVWTVSAGGRVHGRIVDANGAPVPDARTCIASIRTMSARIRQHA